VNISEILKKGELTKNYLSETTSQRMKRFDSTTRTAGEAVDKTNEFRATRYKESGEKRSKTGMGFQTPLGQTLNTSAGGSLFKISNKKYPPYHLL
jgi:hypothetical protein